MTRNFSLLLLAIIAIFLLSACLTDGSLFGSKSDDDDVSKWSINQLQNWLTENGVDWKSMKIAPEKHEYVALVLHYRRAAREHANLAQAKVDESLAELRRELEAKKELKTKNIDKVVDAARGAIVEAQKAGELNAESLKKAFGIAKEEVIKKKTATAEQWDEITTQLESALIGAQNTAREQYHAAVKRAQEGLQTLLDRVRTELRERREMTEENIDYVVDQVRRRIESVQDWGTAQVDDDKTWFETVREGLHKRQAATSDQVQSVMDRLENTYAGYKAAAIDSAKGVYESGQENLQAFIDRVTANLQQYKDVTQETIDSVTTSLRKSLSALPWREVTPAKEETYLESLRSDLSNRRALAADKVQVIVDTVRVTLDDYRIAFLAYANAATDTVQAAYNTATSYAGEAAAQAGEGFASATSKAGDAALSVQDAFESATSYVGDKASSATEAIVGASQTATQRAKETGAEANEEVQTVLDSIKKHFQETKEWSADQVNWVVSYVRDSITGAKKATEQSVESVVDGIRGYLSDTKKASEDEIAKIVDSIRQDLHAWMKKVPWVGKKDEL